MLKCQDASADVLAMETAQQTQVPEMLKVGPDRVTFSGNQVLIDAAHEMADWKVREYARIPIYFRDQKYFLRQKTAAQRPYAQRYVLEPWPEDNQEMARSTLVYDEETVAQREAEINGGRIDDLARAALLLVYPLLGMLWSGTKEKLVRFGFVPRSITGVSIFASFALALLQGAISASALRDVGPTWTHLAISGLGLLGGDHRPGLRPQSPQRTIGGSRGAWRHAPWTAT